MPVICSWLSWVSFSQTQAEKPGLAGCAIVNSKCGVCLHTSETLEVVGLCILPALPPPSPPAPIPGQRSPERLVPCLLEPAIGFGTSPHNSEEC